jgi:deoxycytidylate deaminase
VDRNNPTGLMLLSEVALGDMHELKKATVRYKYLGIEMENLIANVNFYPCILCTRGILYDLVTVSAILLDPVNQAF